MKANDILINSQFAVLNSKVDALIEILDDGSKEKFKNLMTKNLARVYETIKPKMSSEDFEHFRNLCEDGLFRH